MPGLERTGLKGTHLCALTENESEGAAAQLDEIVKEVETQARRTQ